MHSTSLLQSLQDLSIMLRIPNSMVFKSVQYLALGLFCNFLILLSPPLSTWPSFCSSRKPLAISFTWYQFSSVQSLSCVWLFATPWIAARQASVSITNSRSSLRLTFIESVMPSSHLILCRPLLLLPPIPPSIRVFSNESTLHTRQPKYWSFSFSIIPSKEIPGLIFFRMDWLDLLAVQGILTPATLPQKYILEKTLQASIIRWEYECWWQHWL